MHVLADKRMMVFVMRLCTSSNSFRLLCCVLRACPTRVLV